jgi:hypothetical protein
MLAERPHDVQVIALNVLSEGVAFDFYNAVIPILNKLKIHCRMKGTISFVAGLTFSSNPGRARATLALGCRVNQSINLAIEFPRASF